MRNIINRKTGLCLLWVGREAKLLFPALEKQLYFQVSGRFHTLFHSFAFYEALFFTGGTSVTLSWNVLAWGARVLRKSLWLKHDSFFFTSAEPKQIRGQIRGDKLECNSAVHCQHKAELWSGGFCFCFLNGVTSQREKNYSLNLSANMLPGFYWGAAELCCCGFGWTLYCWW